MSRLARPSSRPPGLFVTFEGIEGAGKSTQIMRLRDWLVQERHRAVEITREPGGTSIGRQIRELLLNPDNHRLCAEAELLLYAADRAQHVHERIRPWLAAGRDVLGDRYIHSTLAYQGFGRGLDAAAIERLNAYATGGLMPDLVVLLDLDPAVGLTRARDVGEPDRLEQETLAFHQRVREGFLTLAARDADRFCVIDGLQPTETVAHQVRQRVSVLLGEQV